MKASSASFEFSPATAEALRLRAARLGEDPGQLAEELVVSALSRLDRFGFFSPPQAADADVIARGLSVLDRAGLGNAPDPGDELPPELSEKRASRV